MTDRPRTTGDDRSRDTAADGFGRREFAALGAGASATLLADCAGDGALPSSDGPDGSAGSGDSDGSNDDEDGSNGDEVAGNETDGAGNETDTGSDT